MKVSIAVAARIVSAAVQALLLLVLARETEPSQLATLIALLAMLGFAATALELGIARELTVAAAKQSGTEFHFLNRVHLIGCFAFIVLASLVCHLLGFGFLPIALAVYAAAERRVSALISVMVALGRLNTSSILLVCGRLALLCVYFVGLALFPGKPIEIYAVAIAISSVLLAVAYEYCPKPRLDESGERRSTATILRVSLHYWAATMLGQLRSLDVVLVTAILPSASAALYALPSRALQPLRLIGTSIAGTAFPIAAAGDRERTKQLLRISVAAALANGAIVLLAIPFLPTLLAVIIGAEYEAASAAFILMALGAAINIPGAVLSSILQAHGLQRAITLLGVGLTLFQMTAIFVLSNIFSATGAAVAVPATFIIQLAVTTLIYRRLTRG